MKERLLAIMLMLVLLSGTTTAYADSFDLPEIDPQTGEIVLKNPESEGDDGFETDPTDFIEIIDASELEFTLAANSYVYNGKVKTPKVTVKDKSGKTVGNANYTVSYAKGRKNVGTYKVTLTFKGNYTGKLSKSFKIVPKGTSLSKLTAGKKSFAAVWKKQTAQTTGYQIRYSTDKNFKKAVKTVTVGKSKTVKTTVKKLKKKAKYYVQIRTYKTVGKTKYYSSWSKAKPIKTK
ncbi:MAG: hypothetical protein E7571_03755 [Ruminococcaceae bacterium]|nr:hypothetical protein [Oscillospiraceae bacterium]